MPDINSAASTSTPSPDSSEHGQIVFGMSAVRNVGTALVELIVAERDANGPFTTSSISSNGSTTRAQQAHDRVVDQGRAFDSLGHPRKGLLNVYEVIIDRTVASRKDHDIGVPHCSGASAIDPSFDDRPDIPDLEFEKMPKLAFEKEMLGLYISDHPILGYEAALTSPVRQDRRCASRTKPTVRSCASAV